MRINRSIFDIRFKWGVIIHSQTRVISYPLLCLKNGSAYYGLTAPWEEKPHTNAIFGLFHLKRGFSIANKAILLQLVPKHPYVQNIYLLVNTLRSLNLSYLSLSLWLRNMCLSLGFDDSKP